MYIIDEGTVFPLLIYEGLSKRRNVSHDTLTNITYCKTNSNNIPIVVIYFLFVVSKSHNLYIQAVMNDWRHTLITVDIDQLFILVTLS